VYGGGQSGSIGYVFQTQPVQRSYPFYVYEHNNDAQGVATRMYMDAYVTGGDFKFIGHIGCENQNAPTGAAGANAGTSPPAPVLTRCSDVFGKITWGTGTGPTAGAMAVLTFNTAYPNSPHCVISPINAATAALLPYVDRTTTTMTIYLTNAPAASQANTVYGIEYHISI
jgi:hypothetical protein